MSTTTTFGFGQNDTGIGSRTKKFKAEKGKTYRLGFVWWPGMEDGKEVSTATLTPKEGQEPEDLTPNFIGARQFYAEGVGYVIDTGPEIGQLLGKQSKPKVATIVVSWALGKKGQPTKESLFDELPDVMPWIFSGDKYEKLKKMHLSGYPMHEWDIQADCEDAQYQKLTFLPAKQCIFREMLKNDNERAQEIANHIISQVRALVPNLEREIGQKMTIDQIKEKLGHEVSSPVGGAVAGGDEEVDNILGSMLDD
jgi:hypothetical protein